MAIVRANLKVYGPTENSDAGTNGGRMTANEVLSGVIGNVFPDVGEAERTAGSDKFRKVFVKNENVEADPGGEGAGLELFNPRVFIENFTPGQDEIYLHVGDQVNTQADLTGSEDLFGSGDLDSAIVPTDTVLDVAVHDGTIIQFRDTELIRISDKADIDSAGTEIFRTIVGVPVVNADVVTITVDAQVGANFAAAGVTRVASVFEVPTGIRAGTSAVIVTSGSGTFDSTELDTNNVSTIFQGWTVTFTSATAFDVSGDVVGSVGSGTIGSAFSPTNPDFGLPFFTINSAAWGGTFVASDTVTFTSDPSSEGFWLRRNVPAGTASISGNQTVLVFQGESA